MAEDEVVKLMDAYHLSQKTISILEKLNDSLQETIEREREDRKNEMLLRKQELDATVEKCRTEESGRRDAERKLVQAQNRIAEITKRLGFDREPNADTLNTRIDALLKIEEDLQLQKPEWNRRL